MTARLAVLASGAGSNLQAILDACAGGRVDAIVAAVVTNVPGAGCVERAERAVVPVVVLPRTAGEDRRAYDARLVAALAPFTPDWVVLAGWMRILSAVFLDVHPGRVVNLHPARPGELAGTHAIERAYDEFLAGSRTATGVIVHLVPDEGVDDGPVLAQTEVPIRPGDTLDDLTARVHAAEHALLVATLADLVNPALTPHDA